jgi:hypothetical protein
MRSYTKENIVAQLRRRIASGEKQIDLARTFGVQKQVVSRFLKDPRFLPESVIEQLGYERLAARWRKAGE